MRKLIKKALSASIVFGMVVVMGAFAIFAETESNAGIHIPEIAISVYSPITDAVGHEISANAHSLFRFGSQYSARLRIFDRVQCEDAYATHQEQIDMFLALICEYGIDNISDLIAILQTLQNEGDYFPIVPYSCGNNCKFVPVWVTIDGVTRPAFMCVVCGRIFFVT